jgi:hypothetical protein
MWLEYIPLHQMTYSGGICDGSELLWRPLQQVAFDHHIFTEEEVFKYCVENDFMFPQHKKDDAIVFVAHELCTSSIREDLENLQNQWVRNIIPIASCTD